MKTAPLYWNQPLADNLLETGMLLLTIVFLCYVIRLAFFERDDDEDVGQ